MASGSSTPEHNNVNKYTARIAPKDHAARYQDVPIDAHNVNEAKEIAAAIYSGMNIIWVR
jgi:hypothetical protein